MPAPLLALPILTKAGAFLKGLTGVGTLGKAAGNAAAMKAFMEKSKANYDDLEPTHSFWEKDGLVP